ncbi:Toxin [Xenorhabdus beddingii]|uniref:Toxin n=1 Tax=Xenorhabdus beddingii TaxID=40578 RepID=A0A1Y2SQ58_9GAMM|nr:glycosyltransferase [Xenorhabdus beddingii]OTA21114.1 Toxin [Xenorhabdus beddingii]
MNIPKKIHYFWAGNNISQDGIRNIINVKVENPGFEIHLWGVKKQLFFNTMTSLDIEINPLSETKSPLKTGFFFHDSEDIEKAFLSLKQSPYLKRQNEYEKIIWRLNAIYHRQINGFYHNYASASDIMRLVILYTQGGIYLDVDVELAYAVPKFSLNSLPHKTDNLLKRKAILGNIEVTQGIAFGDTTGSGWTENKFGNAIIAAPPQSREIAILLMIIDKRIQVMHDEKEKSECEDNGWVKWRAEPRLRMGGTMWATGPRLYCGWFKMNQEKGCPSDAKRPRVDNQPNSNIPSSELLPPENMRIGRRGEVIFNSVDGRAQWNKVRQKKRDHRDYAAESPFDLKSSYNNLLRK